MKYHYRTDHADEARDMVEKYHYSGRVPSNVQLIATMHESGGLFGDSGPMVAACFFSIPPTRWNEHVLELSRLVRAETQVPLSQLVSFGCSVLKKRGKKLLVSFADRTQGHHGGIYQACSWKYAGCRERRMDGVVVDGAFIPGRSANSRWGTRSPKKLAEKGIIAQPHYDEGKHLYFKPLGVAGKTRAKRLGLSQKPYAVSLLDEQFSKLCETGANPVDCSKDTEAA